MWTVVVLEYGTDIFTFLNKKSICVHRRREIFHTVSIFSHRFQWTLFTIPVALKACTYSPIVMTYGTRQDLFQTWFSSKIFSLYYLKWRSLDIWVNIHFFWPFSFTAFSRLYNTRRLGDKIYRTCMLVYRRNIGIRSSYSFERQHKVE